MCQGGLPRGRQPQPPPALPALRFLADRGHPQARLCHAPSAAALFAFKSPELGEGRAHCRETRDRVLARNLCFGVQSSDSASLFPAPSV